ncbi:P-loop containing nucleoside triphosphate hydrolase protein [Thozetella sp. PMI_491]|nr:P-loop containing nucleoside triphosphate hydrolase protein [Thozetella sp. PMI_491]
MDSLVQNKTTALQAKQLEDSELNHLRVGSPRHSAAYFKTLEARRKLPVYQKRQAFLDVYQTASVIVLSSDTGLGKTTQIPQFVLYDEFSGGKMVACTQPRRLAAISVAKRVAEEMDVPLGEKVGYSVRFDHATSTQTRLRYMTEGVLLREAISDGSFSKYSCIIIDEAHERTIIADVLMAMLKSAVLRRNDLKVVIMSATLDAHKFQSYFNNAPLFHIPGRAYPVEICYLREETPDYLISCVRTAKFVHETMDKGDILIFLAGEDEIERACALLRKETEGLRAMPLYAALPVARQQEIFGPTSLRKCIVSTNIAETSLTIDGIVYVIDGGLSKRATYDPRARMEILKMAPISQAAARQRSGRAGRTQPGICFRMYTKESFESILMPKSYPGIFSSDIKSAILTLKVAGHNDLVNFDFIDHPAPEILLRGLEELRDLSFLNADGYITQSGRHAAMFPVDPIWYRVIGQGHACKCALEMVTLAAIFTTQRSIFLRPHPQRHVADLAREQFVYPFSDHITHLNAVHAYVRAMQEENFDMDQWCFDHFLNRPALEEVLQLRAQLKDLLRQLNIPLNSVPFSDASYYTNIRKALALGFFQQTAIMYQGHEDTYRTIHQGQHALLAPDSALVKGAHEWVVYHVFRLTGKQYLHTVTAIEPEWIAELPYFHESRMPIRPKTGAVKQLYVKESLDKARERLGSA